MGPVSPATTPSSAVLSNCWVVLAWTVGAGFSVETALRARTSKRGMACVNGWTPNSGLGGRPVGMVEPNAYALLTKGLRPLFATITPPAVNRPHFSRSRRVICPSASAFRISQRFFRAFSASHSRRFDDFFGRNNMDTPPFDCHITLGWRVVAFARIAVISSASVWNSAS